MESTMIINIIQKLQGPTKMKWKATYSMVMLREQINEAVLR